MALYESFNGKDDITSFLFNPDFVYYDNGVASYIDEETGRYIRTSGSLESISKSSTLSFASTSSTTSFEGVGLMIIPRKDGEFSSITLKVTRLVSTTQVAADVYFYKKDGTISSKTSIDVNASSDPASERTLDIPDDTVIIFMRLKSIGRPWTLTLNT